MKEFKRKNPYIVARFEPMNNTPKVLSNESKYISYRLIPEIRTLISQRPEDLYQNKVEIRRKGISRRWRLGLPIIGSEAIFNNAMTDISSFHKRIYNSCESRRNEEGGSQVRKETRETRRDRKMGTKKKISRINRSRLVKIVAITLQPQLIILEMTRRGTGPSNLEAWHTAKVWKLADMIRCQWPNGAPSERYFPLTIAAGENIMIMSLIFIRDFGYAKQY